MERLTFLPVVGLCAAAVFVGHLGLMVLPANLAGLSTPVLLLCGVAGVIAAAIRWS